MKIACRSKRFMQLAVQGREFAVNVVEIPFREGLELRCIVGGEAVQVSDRGLGFDEALRLLQHEIEVRLKEG